MSSLNGPVRRSIYPILFSKYEDKGISGSSTLWCYKLEHEILEYKETPSPNRDLQEYWGEKSQVWYSRIHNASRYILYSLIRTESSTSGQTWWVVIHIFIHYNKCDSHIWEKPAISEPHSVCSNHNSFHDRNKGIKRIVMRLSKRSGTNSSTNFQSPIIRCLGIDDVWIRFANDGDHIPRKYGCRIWRHGSGNLSHESIKYVVV